MLRICFCRFYVTFGGGDYIKVIISFNLMSVTLK